MKSNVRRDAERPPKVSPAEHSLSTALTRLASSPISPRFFTRFSLHSTTPLRLRTNRSSGALGSWLRRTFARPLFLPKEVYPPKWTNTCGQSNGFKITVKHIFIVPSQYEVNRPLPFIRKSDHVHLHLYTPRTTESMKQSDDLRLYSIPNLSFDWTLPRELMAQLSIFAGQLYLSHRAAYIQLCRWASVCTPRTCRTKRR